MDGCPLSCSFSSLCLSVPPPSHQARNFFSSACCLSLEPPLETGSSFNLWCQMLCLTGKVTETSGKMLLRCRMESIPARGSSQGGALWPKRHRAAQRQMWLEGREEGADCRDERCQTTQGLWATVQISIFNIQLYNGFKQWIMYSICFF